MDTNTAATALRTPEARLYGTCDEVLVPTRPVTAANQPVVALDLFGSFLVNNTEEAKRYGNVLVGWDQIPKFSAEYLNNKDGQVPNDHSVDFRIGSQQARLTLFPGTFYPTKTSKPMRRYPGVKEQMLEQALIHHAIVQAEEQTVNGNTSYCKRCSRSRPEMDTGVMPLKPPHDGYVFARTSRARMSRI